VVPVSRAGALAPVGTLVIWLLAVVGARRLASRWGLRPLLAAGTVAAIGLLLALAGTTSLGRAVLGEVVTAVPGSGLLRDGQKFVLPLALLLATAAALGIEALAERLTGPAVQAVLVAGIALPVLLLPDLAWGAWGRLAPVHYPRDWDRVAAVVAEDHSAGLNRELVTLPFGAFRRYPWTDGRIVLDPAARYFPADVLVDDALPVGDRLVAGEGTRAAAVRSALDAGRPLTATGVRWVIVERTTPGETPAVALDGLRLVWQGPELTLYENPRPTGRPAVSVIRRVAIVAGYVVASSLLVWVVILRVRGFAISRLRKNQSG
jgi:hypothetical protein